MARLMLNLQILCQFFEGYLEHTLAPRPEAGQQLLSILVVENDEALLRERHQGGSHLLLFFSVLELKEWRANEAFVEWPANPMIREHELTAARPPHAESDP